MKRQGQRMMAYFLNLVVMVTCCIVGPEAVFAGVPVDQHATRETKQLLNILHTMSRDHHKVLFGQQGPTWFGAHGGHAPYRLASNQGKLEAWTYTSEMARANQSDELCDVCGVVNDFPAVVGMDLNALDKHNSVTLTHLTHLAWERGAIVTVSWHHKNPVTGGSVYVKDDQGPVFHSVNKLLPRGDYHHNLLADLDMIADWAKSLTDSKGRSIPVIFRPWHEATGAWFWWGLGNDAHNTPSDVSKLFQVTVDYLRHTKGVHNFLYAFSPDCSFDWTDDVIYPGDEYVDVIGQDCYQSPHRSPDDVVQAVERTVTRATSAGKVAALTEFGLTTQLTDRPHFFTRDVLQPMINSSKAMGVAYMMTWANRCQGDGTCAVYTPHPGHPLAGEFRNFYQDSHTMFLSNLRHYAAWFYTSR